MLLLVPLLLTTLGALPATPRAPLVVLEYVGMPMAQHRTQFVLYDDGLVLYSVRKRESEFGSGYAAVLLDETERDALMARLPLAAPFAALPVNEDAAGPSVRDGLWQQICVWRAKLPQCAGVRGYLDAGESSHRARARPAFLAAYDALVTFGHPRARPWVPESVSLRYTPGRARGAAKPWPKKWQTAMEQHAAAPAEYQPEHITLSLPGSELRALQQFLSDNQPVRLGARRGWMSLQIELPAESAWLQR